MIEKAHFPVIIHKNKANVLFKKKKNLKLHQ